MDNTIKQWIKNWLKGLKEIEKKHAEDKDNIWITTNEAVELVLEARNIFKELLK